MGRPQYAKGSIARTVLSVLDDAGAPLTKSQISKAVSTRLKRDVTPHTALITVKRLIERGHALHMEGKGYMASIPSIPEEHDCFESWAAARQAEGLDPIGD